MLLFRVLPNFHECLYNSIETRSTCFLFLLETTRREKGKQLVNFDYQNVNSLSHVITTSTAHASSVSPSSYTNTIFNQSVCCAFFGLFSNTFYYCKFLLFFLSYKLKKLTSQNYFLFKNNRLKDNRLLDVLFIKPKPGTQ